MIATVIHCLRGTPYICQGEETGLEVTFDTTGFECVLSNYETCRLEKIMKLRSYESLVYLCVHNQKAVKWKCLHSKSEYLNPIT